MAEVLPADSPAAFERAVARAAEWLRLGEVVALPTETVYGLAANALDARAVDKIFVIKGRPAHNPIIVHAASGEMVRACAAQWPESADKLAAAFWPGPLTIVLPKSQQVPDNVTAGGGTVGIRWPSHPVIQAVIQRCGFPLAAPSANLSGQISPTTAEHVCRGLGDRVGLVVDGGPAEVGIESTVLDLSVWPPRILRPGIIHAESLAAVMGEAAAIGQAAPGLLRSPGLLLKHYSPQAKLVIWDGAVTLNTPSDTPPERMHLLTRGGRPAGLRFGHICRMPQTSQAYAKALYAELHRADAAGAEAIVVEAVPKSSEWAGIADRLRRAAAAT